MRRLTRELGIVGVLLVAVVSLLAPFATGRTVPTAVGPILIAPVSPLPNTTVYSSTPTIVASYSDLGPGSINPSTVYLFVDRTNITGISGFNVSTTQVSYTPPTILRLNNSNHTATVVIVDTDGNSASLTWNFTVNTNAAPPSNPLGGIKITQVLFFVGIGAAIALAAVGGYILFLKQTTRFTFRRYFATHPVERNYLVVYIPFAVAFAFVIVGLLYVYSTPGLPSNAVDYVFIIATFIALTLWGIDSRREMLRIRTYERAFAQLLFELADAMRGGIDPAKAIVELSKTHTNILRKGLRIAADGVRLGRPFDEVLRDMVAPMRSRLITRYAGLIADATSIGGETATVVYRAAKDMDDFVKIEEEREKKLYLPVAVIYIAFGVLTAVLVALLFIAPDLGSININFLSSGHPLSSGGSSSSGATTIPHLPFSVLKERFFELMLINALGTGAIIGAFTEGRARYGILHSLALVAGTAIIFAILFP
ncbi:MAG: type II secretion system F family protein [Thermoplasmata archaeon]|nr:type II secretion system F family protein [Thermoplasmata archaeon]